MDFRVKALAGGAAMWLRRAARRTVDIEVSGDTSAIDSVITQAQPQTNRNKPTGFPFTHQPQC